MQYRDPYPNELEQELDGNDMVSLRIEEDYLLILDGTTFEIMARVHVTDIQVTE